MGALDKLLFPDLTNNPTANLLGIDAVKRARGRGLLDAGLRAIALSGPRPATENINPAMILSDSVSSGMNTYDKAIDRATKQLQTTTALKDSIQNKENFNSLIASDFLNNEEKAFALTLGHVEGSKFIANLYMQKQKNLDKVPSVKKMVIMDTETNKPVLKDDGTPLKEYVSVKDILNNPKKYQIPEKEGTYAQNIRDFENLLNRKLTFEEKRDYVLAIMNGNEKDITITQNENGSTTFSIGGSGSSMEKKTKQDTEKLVIQAYSNFDDFRQVEKLWRPEFNTLPTQMKVGWTKFKNKLGEWNWFSEATDDEKQLVRDFSAWEQKSWEIANSYIKSITGAQMSEKEAERILKGFPDPRLGKTDPVAYKTKLDGILKSAQNSIIRYNLLLAKGIDIPRDGNNNLRPDHIMSLMSVDAWVDKIGLELETELKQNPAYNGFSQDEIEKEVIKQMQVLLGLQRDDKISYTLEDLQ